MVCESNPEVINPNTQTPYFLLSHVFSGFNCYDFAIEITNMTVLRHFTTGVYKMESQRLLLVILFPSIYRPAFSPELHE